ncbi:type II toxin-antitoxin system RelB/DinJ family antitoxin [[Limnothrix rosea] IAM M-220]|uniref:type II toxin-antitoxin system RelB/DinJ family antitoxin n=1 Tax=[Limnothrix rosea] IAM M-220 TaxID=454133 RepID=UPI0009595F80|nr:type II toxin-antitoxin system RelB/DinJ family antitoxin [[Limnothrix rosea] IAM M-220]OKH19737.1 hypothetical protein NIES208_01000 [[Limnothrix rosea] IAM M-220]
MDNPVTVEVNIEETLQQDVEKILGCLGLSVDQAIALFYEQIAKHNGLPFQSDDCNGETLETFTATDRGDDLVVCEDADDMFSRLGI